jgi:hypothetical protein
MPRTKSFLLELSITLIVAIVARTATLIGQAAMTGQGFFDILRNNAVTSVIVLASLSLIGVILGIARKPVASGLAWACGAWLLALVLRISHGAPSLVSFYDLLVVFEFGLIGVVAAIAAKTFAPATTARL